jgi:hypothetical protein
MGLRELLDSILPADTPEEVKKKMVEYGRKNPELSEKQVLDKFSGSMSRAKRKATEKQEKTVRETPKNVPTGRMKNYKAEMANGGVANGKKHMYSSGGFVQSRTK